MDGLRDGTENAYASEYDYVGWMCDDCVIDCESVMSVVAGEPHGEGYRSSGL